MNCWFTSRSCFPSSTFFTKARANTGSMPLDAPAMALMVPVGAMHVRVALRIGFSSGDDARQPG